MIYAIFKKFLYLLCLEVMQILFYSNIHILYKQINSELNRLYVWFNVNKLSLNMIKTNYMTFSNRKSTQTFYISINGVNIRRVCAVKYLGVYIDDK